ncbi:MAG: heavy-metal-associated domain-containing protein [bacterium]
MTEQANPEMNEVTRRMKLELSGLHCGGCAMRVTEALKQLPGVRSVNFSPERDSCEIELDGIHAQPEDYVAAVEGIGFSARYAG